MHVISYGVAIERTLVATQAFSIVKVSVGVNVPLAGGRGDALSSTVLSCDSSGCSFRLALPASADPSLGVAIVG
jgi:hypothetical protein